MVQSSSSAQDAPRDSVNASFVRGVWSEDEHSRFLDALKRYPQGPWKVVAEYIGTRSIRQVQTHAQKYQEKVLRRARGLKTAHPRVVKRDHRIDEEVEQWWTRESAMLTGSPTHPRAVSRRRRRVMSEDMRESVDSLCDCDDERRSGSPRSTTGLKLGEDEDDSGDDERLYEDCGGIGDSTYEPLSLQFHDEMDFLPTLEECLAVVNECLVEQTPPATAHPGHNVHGILI